MQNCRDAATKSKIIETFQTGDMLVMNSIGRETHKKKKEIINLKKEESAIAQQRSTNFFEFFFEFFSLHFFSLYYSAEETSKLDEHLLLFASFETEMYVLLNRLIYDDPI